MRFIFLLFKYLSINFNIYLKFDILCVMKTYEFNYFDVNNSAVESLDVDNGALSDELVVDEFNKNSFQNEFAKSKRASLLLNKGLVLSSLTISVVAGGAFLSNAFVKSEPLINNFDNCLSLNNNVLSYNFDLTIKDYDLLFRIEENKNIIHEICFEKSGVYNGEFVLELNKDYELNFYSTNKVDYLKIIEQYSKLIHVEGIDNGK